MLLTRRPSCNQCTIAVVMTTYDTDILFLIEFYDRCSSRRLRIYFRSLFFSTSWSLFDDLLALNFEESKYHSTSGKGNKRKVRWKCYSMWEHIISSISSKILNNSERFENFLLTVHKTFRITNLKHIFRQSISKALHDEHTISFIKFIFI